MRIKIKKVLYNFEHSKEGEGFYSIEYSNLGLRWKLLDIDYFNNYINGTPYHEYQIHRGYDSFDDTKALAEDINKLTKEQFKTCIKEIKLIDKIKRQAKIDAEYILHRDTWYI